MLLDKTITWGDESTEHVQINELYRFILDGEEKNLLGFEIGYNGFPNGDRYYFTEGNPAILEAELADMQTAGIRIVAMTFRYPYSSTYAQFEIALDLFYQYKMLVVPYLVMKWVPTFDSGDNGPADNFLITGSDYRDDHVADATDKFLEYDNVVAIGVENEIDYPLDDYPTPGTDQEYTTAEVAEYLSECKAIVTGKTTLPFFTKLMGYFGVEEYNNLQIAALPYSVIPCWDPYESSVANFTIGFTTMKQRGANDNDRPGHFWLTEFGTPTGGAPVAANMTEDMIDNAFAKGASVVFLFTANRQQDNDACFFNDLGDPIDTTTNVVFANLSKWQRVIKHPLPIWRRQ